MDLECPLSGPRFPFDAKTKDVFRKYYRDRLREHQDAFESYFKESNDDKSEASDRLQAELPEVVARDAWREAFSWYLSNTLAIPFVLLCALLVTPFLIVDEPWWQDVLAVFLGISGGLAILFMLL